MELFEELNFHIQKGAVYVYFAFDIGASIQLDKAEKQITTVTERLQILSNKRVSRYFDFSPAPIRLVQKRHSLPVMEGFQTEPQIEVLLFEFGSVSVCFKIPIQSDFFKLLQLSEVLYENAMLKKEARDIVEQLLGEIRSVVVKEEVSNLTEDYIIFQLDRTEIPWSLEHFVGQYSPQIASLLRSDSSPVPESEINDIVSHHISYGPKDITIVHWSGAFIVSEGPQEDIRTVLEFANAALLEFVFLDQKLDRGLDEAYENFLLARQKFKIFPLHSMRKRLTKISQYQIDNAILHENITNTLKLFGDDYYSRLYELASKRLSLSKWDASITRKLNTLESIYKKLSDDESSRRMEVLEIIIIILFVLSIAISFLPGMSK